MANLVRQNLKTLRSNAIRMWVLES